MDLISDVRRAGRIVRWERIVAKRTFTTGSVRRVVGFVFIAIFFVSMALATVAPFFAGHGSQGARNDFLFMLSLFGGAFLLYMQMLLMYNRIVIASSELLLTAPINGRTVLMARVAGGFRLSLLYAAAGLPLVIAYGMASRVLAVYYPLAVLFLVLESVMITALSLVIVMLLMVVLRRKISRDFLAVVSSVLAAAIFIAPRLFAFGHMGAAMSGQFWQGAAFFVLPFMWFARGLIALSEGAAASVLYAVLSLLVTSASLALSLGIGQRSLHERLTRMTDEKDVQRRRKRRAAPARSPAGATLAVMDQTHAPGGQTWTTVKETQAAEDSMQPLVSSARDPARTRWRIPPAVVAIGKKDLLRLKRTPGDLVSYLFPTIYLLYFLLQPPSSSAGQPIVALVPLFLLVLTSTMGRIPIASFGMEGEQVWIYMQSPVSVNRLIGGKWLYSSIPTFLWWELLAILLGVLGAASHPLIGVLMVAGLWLVPSATALTLPFAVHGAAFKARRVGQRNVYVTRASGFYLLVLLPYLLVQSAATAVASLPFLSISLPLGWLTAGDPAWRVALGLGASFLLAVAASFVGWSMSTEAWRSKVVLLLQAGSLD
ncbi:MAG: putative ABC transporter permease subunit [Bacilli bacterium]